jgi:hypothetical protein
MCNVVCVCLLYTFIADCIALAYMLLQSPTQLGIGGLVLPWPFSGLLDYLVVWCHFITGNQCNQSSTAAHDTHLLTHSLTHSLTLH